MNKKYLRLGLGICLAGLFAWLILRGINWRELRATLAAAQGKFIVAAIVAFIVGYSFRVLRWHAMLKHDSPNLRASQVAGPFLASFAANNVLPFRAGDVMRAFAFNKTLNTTSGTVLATLFVERLLDLLMVIVMLGGALLVFQINTIAGVGASLLLAGAALILFVLLFPRSFSSLISFAANLVKRISPSIGEKIQQEANKAITTLTTLAQGSMMLKLLGFSICAWIAEGLVFYFAALSLPALDAPHGAWLALPTGTLATLIPSTPGYVGTFDFFTVHAMKLLGNGQIAATAYAFLVHALLWFPPTLLGGLYIAKHSIKTPKTETLS